MKDLIKEDGKDWGFWGHYNFRGAMMYRICHIILVNYSSHQEFYFASTNKDRTMPIAFGKTLDDFDLYLDKTQLYFSKTTPSRYRIYLESMFCKTYGDKVRAGFYAVTNIRNTEEDEIFWMGNFPKEAFEKYLKRTREYKSITYNGKIYSMWRLRKYINEPENILDPHTYNKAYLYEPVDIDDVPDRKDGEKELFINNLTIYGMMIAISKTFGIYKKVYVAYLDKELLHPVGVGLSRYDMQFYQKRLKRLYYKETTPVKFLYFYEVKIHHSESEGYNPAGKRIDYIWFYFILLSHQLDKKVFDYIIDDGITIDHMLNKMHYKKYSEQRENLIKKIMIDFKFRDDIYDDEMFKTDNLMKDINYSKIQLCSDYRRED